MYSLFLILSIQFRAEFLSLHWYLFEDISLLIILLLYMTCVLNLLNYILRSTDPEKCLLSVQNDRDYVLFSSNFKIKFSQ